MKFSPSYCKNESKDFFMKNLYKPNLPYCSTSETEDEDDCLVNDADVASKNHLPLAFSESIAEFMQKLLDERFLVDDLSFIFEISQKRTLSPCTILLAMIYLKRLKQSSSKCVFSFSNSELCLVSMIVASKYLIDEGEINEIYNDEWAVATNLSVKKINRLEKSMLNDLNWELYVAPDEFWNFTDKIHLLYLSKKLRSQNGLVTYDDMKFLSENAHFLRLIADQFYYCLYKTMLICSVTLIHTVYTSILAYLLLSNVHAYMNEKNHWDLQVISVKSTDNNQVKPIEFVNSQQYTGLHEPNSTNKIFAMQPIRKRIYPNEFDQTYLGFRINKRFCAIKGLNFELTLTKKLFHKSSFFENIFNIKNSIII